MSTLLAIKDGTNNIHLTLLSRFFFVSLSLPIPIVVLFQQKNGLSLNQVAQIQIVYTLLLALFEVPSGYIADLAGRKRTLISASLSLLLGIICFLLGTNYWSFLFGDLFIALGFSLVTGTDQALLYESLKELSRADEYSKYWGIATAVDLAGGATGAVVGGYLAEVNIRLPFLVATLGFAGYFAICTQFTETRLRRVEEVATLKEHLFCLWKTIKECFQRSPALRWLILLAAFSGAFDRISRLYIQPILSEEGFRVAKIGWVYAAMSLAGGMYAISSFRMERWVGKIKTMYVVVTVFAICCVGIGIVGPAWASIGLIIVFQILRGATPVITSELINEYAGNYSRASAMSFVAVATRLIYSIVIFVVSAVISYKNLRAGYICMGVLSIGFFGLLFWICPIKSFEHDE